VIWAKEIQSDPDPEAAKERFVKAYDKEFATPYLAGALRVIDDVIYPAETRMKIIQALHMLEKKDRPRSPKRHGIMPV
jgi:propionyl-CoA carboxylase beta chain